MNLSGWLDPTWRFATTVGECYAALVVAFAAGWVVRGFGRTLKWAVATAYSVTMPT